LVIELDGGQHYSQKGIIKDQERDNYLQGLNLRILRFSDRDIFENINGVIERINDYL
jgi:very-short-patch-repair endonuclease